MNNHKYQLDTTVIFKKDLKRAKKRGLNIDLLYEVVNKLQNGEKLPEKNRDHELTGNWINHRECHIQPDWLLIYSINKQERKKKMILNRKMQNVNH